MPSDGGGDDEAFAKEIPKIISYLNLMDSMQK